MHYLNQILLWHLSIEAAQTLKRRKLNYPDFEKQLPIILSDPSRSLLLNYMSNLQSGYKSTPISTESSSEISNSPQSSVDLSEKISNENILVNQRKVRKTSLIKSSQSKFKNVYGLLIGRIIRTCKDYLDLSKEELNAINKNSRFYYIHMKLLQLDEKEKADFMKYLWRYHAQNQGVVRNRGLSNVKNYLNQDLKNGLNLIDLVYSFLNKENADLIHYISNDQNRKKHLIQVLNDELNLNKIRKHFDEFKHEIMLKICAVKQES